MNAKAFGSLLATSCVVGLAACASQGVGDSGGLLGSVSASSSAASTGAGGDEPASPAKALFLDEVYPALEAACVSCHGEGSIATQFLGPDGESAYAAIKTFASIVTKPALSRLLTKGKHAGPALTAAQATTCTEWLELELAENPSNDPPPPIELTPQQQLEAFGKCLSKADWDATNVKRLAKQTAKSQNNLVPCSSCHGKGANGTFLDEDDLAMFEATRKIPYIFKFASTSLKEDGTFSDIASANRWVEKGAEGCPPLGNCHPEYLLDADLVADINALFNLTYDRWKKGGCVDAPAEAPKP